MKLRLLIILLCSININAFAAVILQYHHVSDNTPKSTSISPEQFEVHLQYLKDNNFTVVPLSELINAIKKQQPLVDKTVAITFDDAYQDNFTHAKPLLDKFGYPYTIFVNPAIINMDSPANLSWKQLKNMANDGVIIANHGMNHDSIARNPKGMSQSDWLEQYTKELIAAETLIEEKIGKSWRYFAFSYGEYTPRAQQWMKDNDYIAFTQQSGAVGLATDLTIVPRFPASQPYDKISGLRDKLNSLPLAIRLENESAETIFYHQASKLTTFTIVVDDFDTSQLNCYISGLGRQKIEWQEENSFIIRYSSDLPVGRVRCNCTAPSISEPGRYYWYSKPWFILNADGQWYHL